MTDKPIVSNNYDLIIECYHSGQIDLPAFIKLIESDEVFKKYFVKKIWRTEGVKLEW